MLVDFRSHDGEGNDEGDPLRLSPLVEILVCIGAVPDDSIYLQEGCFERGSTKVGEECVREARSIILGMTPATIGSARSRVGIQTNECKPRRDIQAAATDPSGTGEGEIDLI